MSRAEALGRYVEWMCSDPQVQALQLRAADDLSAVYRDGTWHFSYQGGWYVFYRGAVIHASMRESTGVVVPDSPTDETQAASQCWQLSG